MGSVRFGEVDEDGSLVAHAGDARFFEQLSADDAIPTQLKKRFLCPRATVAIREAGRRKGKGPEAGE